MQWVSTVIPSRSSSAPSTRSTLATTTEIRCSPNNYARGRSAWDVLCDIQAAFDHLRKQGLKSAEKKAGRIAAEGAIEIAANGDGKSLVIMEINSETDFVANTDDFKELLKDIAIQAEARNQTIILVSHELELPAELHHLSARFEMSLPDDKARTPAIRGTMARNVALRSIPASNTPLD